MYVYMYDRFENLSRLYVIVTTYMYLLVRRYYVVVDLLYVALVE